MKRSVFALMIAIVFLTFACEGSDKKTTNPPSESITRIYKINFSSGSIVQSNILPRFVLMPGGSTKEAEFNEIGKLSKVKLFDGNNNLTGFYVYEMNEDNKPVKRLCKDETDSLWYQYWFSYNDDRQINKYYTKSSVNTTLSYVEQNYNEKKQLVSIYQYPDDTKIRECFRLKLEYNEQDKVSMCYSTQGGFTTRCAFTYIENTKHINIYYNAVEGDPISGNFFTYRVFTYDIDGNLINVYFADSGSERNYEYVKEEIIEDNSDNWQQWYNFGNDINNLIDPPN